MIRIYKNCFHKLANLETLQLNPRKLQEMSILMVPLFVGPVSFVWSLLYLANGQYIAASVVILYSFISLFNLLHYEKTNNLLAIQKTQMFLVLIIPFILTWVLGGFTNSSYIIVWSFFAPIAAIIHEKRGKAKYWLFSFLALTFFSVIIDPWLINHTTNHIPKNTQEIFFLLNISASLTGIFYLLKFFIYKKDKKINKKLEAKNKQLMNYTHELNNTISYLESYKNSIDANLIVTKTDINGNITFANENFYKISGFTPQEIMGKTHSIVKHPNTSVKVFEELWETILAKKTWHGRIQNRAKDGSSYWIDTTISPILNKAGDIAEFIAIRHDVSELLKQQDELQKMLFTDSLTNLKNRNALIKELREDKIFSIVLINIDNFSQINNLYGEKFGDKVLIYFSEFLQNMLKQVSDSCELFRLAGDEFVLLSQNTNPKDIREKVDNFLKYMDANPLTIDEQKIALGTTVGISFEEKEHLLPTANMALKIAKRSSKRVVLYSNELSLNAEYENNIHWIKEIKEAIKDDRITLYYQPIIDNDTNQINKFETLIRLIQKDGTVISPIDFLEIAKQSKIYKELTQIVIKKSFEAFKDNDYDFSVNITIDDILDKNITSMIEATLKEYDISNRVIFEIVESESIDNFQEVEDFIHLVKSYGCKISIDDFGTGYSNFEYLMRLQADFIKIDGSIIKEIVKDKRSELITSVIVSFAKEMQIKTIGEYVESKEIHDKLVKLGVNKSQGYYFSKPQSKLP